MTQRDTVLEAPCHDRALERLEAVYAAYREGERVGRVAIIHGPRGHWAESLLDAFKRHVVSRREPWFEAACEGSAGRTYGPLRELLSQYLNHLEVLGLVDEELARRFAEVGGLLGLGSTALPAAPGGEALARGQLQFYEQLGELLQECSTRCPAVLGLRDLHLADSTTRAAVRFVIEHYAVDSIGVLAPEDVARRRFRGLLVVTTQDDEAAMRPLRAATSRSSNVEIVSLAGVDLETVRRFLQEPEVIERFLLSSAGSPDNLRALVEDLPERVDDLFARRLARLEPQARALLEVLAVYDRPAAPELLARLGEVDAVRFAALMARLIEERFVTQRVRRGQFQIGLAAPHTQRLIYKSLEPQRRSALHLAIGTLLEERVRLGHTIDPEELAHHFIHSGDDARAIEHALSAAERLHMTFAYQRASEYLVAVLPRLRGAAYAERRQTVLERLVDLNGSLGEFRRALFYCGHLKRELAPGARGEAYRRAARVLLQMGRYGLALRVLGRARALWPVSERVDAHGQVERLRTLAAIAEAHYGLGEHEPAVEACAQGQALSSTCVGADAQRELAELRNTRGKVAIARKAYDEALVLFEQNIELGRGAGWPDEEFRGLFNCGIVALLRDDFVRAERIFSDCLGYRPSTTNPLMRAHCLLNIAVIDHRTQRFNRALEYYLHSLATFRSSGSNTTYVATALNVGELYLDLGDVTRASALVQAAAAVLEQHEIHHYRAWMLYLDGRILSERGALSEARVRLEEAGRIAVEKKWAKARELFVDLAAVCFRLGDEAAYAHYIALDAAHGDSDETRAQSARLRGLVAWARGESPDALRELEHAATLYQSAARMHPLWEVLHERALLEAELGRAAAARTRLQATRELVTGLVAEVPESLRSAFTSRPSCAHFFASLEALQHGGSPLSAGLPPLVREARERRSATLEGQGATARRSGRAGSGSSARVEAAVVDAAWRARYARIIGHDPRLHEVFTRVDRIARSTSPVLVLGESGTGKELLADAIHRNSDRASGPFVKVNCGAFVETLLLSELFGHEKGAFTGALSRKPGRFELADGGTLFLDEIGDISPNTQVALLRVLQERSFERVGGSQTLEVDVRVVCATNRNLEQLVKNGQFRLDLYYRLKGIVLELPPLRERLGDVPLLVEHFLAEQAGADSTPPRLSRGALRRLLCYGWPGNIRELQNFVRSLALFVPGPVIEPEHIDPFRDFFSEGELREPDAAVEAVVEATLARTMQRALGTAPDHHDHDDDAHDDDDDDAELAPDDDADGDEEGLETAPPARPFIAHELSGAPASAASDPEALVVAHVLSGQIGLAELKKRLEIECIRRALEETDGNITRAANLLQMKRPRLSQIVNSTPELQDLRPGGAA